MTIGACTRNYPHVMYERGWKPTSDEAGRIFALCSVSGAPLGENSDVTSAFIKLTSGSIERHDAEEQRNLERQNLHGAEKSQYYRDAGMLARLGSHICNLSLRAAAVFEDPGEEKLFDKITLEVLGSIKNTLCVEDASSAIGEQIEKVDPEAVYWPLTGQRAQPSFKFFPYFKKPDHGDFSFAEGWLQVRHPLSNVVIPNGAPINLFLQKEIMLYLPRTDSDTVEELGILTDQQWSQEGQNRYSRISTVVAPRVYEQYMAEPDNLKRNMFLTRTQVLATALRGSV